MSVNEELREHSEHAQDPFTRQAGAAMAIIAAGLAMVAVYGQLCSTEELLAQQKASDQWAFYQAKSLRRYQSEVARDLLALAPAERAEKTAAKFEANIERYTKEGEEISEKAKELEQESALMGRRALRLHVGEVFLELAIVFSSLAILSRRRMFFYVAVCAASVGFVVGLSALLLGH